MGFIKQSFNFIAMKKITILFIPAFIALFSFGGSHAVAQKAEKTNVKKELNQILKELSEEEQLKILKYAQKRRDAVSMTATEKVEAKEQAMATPQPQKAKPVKEEQSIQLSPNKNEDMVANSPVKAQSEVITPRQPSFIEKANSMEPTTVEWSDESYKFGKVKSGDVVKHTFTFKNTGTEPLVLTRVKASCGCTTPKWSQEPIQPGEEGFIDVSFNSTGKVGIQNKTVTVTGNFDKLNKILRISGEVTKE